MDCGWHCSICIASKNINNKRYFGFS